MRRLDRAHLEVLIGLLLMVSSFLLSFLMIIRILELDLYLMMVLSFILYALSLIGLVLGLHGLYELLIPHRRK
ncbi:MAG: hypothetical protein ACUVQ0_04010 [Thermoproteota archaeon]